MNIFITGGAGFIGQACIRKMMPEHSITCVDNLDPQVHGMNASFPKWMTENVHCIKADVRDIARYASHLARQDVIIHLAAQTGTGQSMYERSRYVGSNVEGTANLLDAVQSNCGQLTRFVLSSSRAVYGEGMLISSEGIKRPAFRPIRRMDQERWEPVDENDDEGIVCPMTYGNECRPTSVYGMTKLWQEELLMKYALVTDTEAIIMRIQNAYGPGQSLSNPYTGIIGLFSTLLRRGEPVELFEDGMMLRDFVFIDDVVATFEKAAIEQMPDAQTIDLGTGMPVTLVDLVQVIASVGGYEPEYHVSGRYRLGDVRHAYADTSSIKKWINVYEPKDIRAGIALYMSWFTEEEGVGDAIAQKSFEELNDHGILRTGDRRRDDLIGNPRKSPGRE